MPGRISGAASDISLVVRQKVVLHLLEHIDARRRLGKPAYRGQDAVVLEKVFDLELVDAPLSLHHSQDFIIPVFSNVRETAGEDNQAPLLAAKYHLLEDPPVHMVVVDHTTAHDDVVGVLPLLRELIDVIDVELDQLRIHSFRFGYVHHALGQVTADNVFETFLR